MTRHWPSGARKIKGWTQCGFTLIELSVVLVIVALVAGLVIPAVPDCSRIRSPHWLHQQDQANRTGTPSFSFGEQPLSRVAEPTKSINTR